MALLPIGRALPLACLLAPLGACVAAGDSSAGRASALATTVSRATTCKAGSPQRSTLDRFLAAEKARGADEQQIAAARAAYVGVSEAEMVNQGVRPQPCTAEERAELKARMGRIRAGEFDKL
ncbi:MULTISPECIES: hypothetical protein [Bosea]|uniref:hypothetical protein n=1 Tax=Bosea TaxID=85413 RepID=UPI0021505021|nr:MULTISPECIES: hypothetical protein [Bosea]MCR4521138.1 hypothetical protein [Bosea sp. 47.2.35]MDR6830904.1 hypothetical protein [Bosea robiniae]MDR6897688.1 hypothetical protein [Bosea sp. BE109]MDR7141085.1 hypothetical protein [Bosea sp. BE168]MDR7177605.1 hypothetical protein [Bosea sp. BE271]